MKLSEAMRRGSKCGKQAFGRWYGQDGKGCALMLTAIGMGMIKNVTMETVFIPMGLMVAFPELQNPTVATCGCSIADHQVLLWYHIQHLNDIHEWSSERIAGWIEANVEVPTYSMLEIQEFMGEPLLDPVEVKRV